MYAVNIRKALPLDISDLLEIEHLSFPTCWLEDFLVQGFNRDVTRLWLACLRGNKEQAAGYLAAMRVIDQLHILQIATHPKYRRKGIATAMLEHALDVERGLKSVLLEVRESNGPAISFYKRRGFDYAGKRPRYYSDTGEAALLLVRELR